MFVSILNIQILKLNIQIDLACVLIEMSSWSLSSIKFCWQIEARHWSVRNVLTSHREGIEKGEREESKRAEIKRDRQNSGGPHPSKGLFAKIIAQQYCCTKS